MLRKGDVRVNGEKTPGGRRLELGDLVVAHHSTARPSSTASSSRHDRTIASYEGPPIEILHEGRGLLVVNKPAGISCDHGEGGAQGLLNWAQQRFAREIDEGNARPAAPHRLDTGTTGAVCVGWTAAALEAFRLAQSEGRVLKHYWVVVWGRPLEEEFELTIPLMKLPHAPRRKPKVVPALKKSTGAQARTLFRWIAAGHDASLLLAIPSTGRTHQIRAHCRAHGLPVVGDSRYGDRGKDRDAKLSGFLDHQLLHAARLSLDDSELGFSVEAPLPAEFLRALGILGISLPASLHRDGRGTDRASQESQD